MVDTRESLMSAASALLAEEGPEALTVRRIAAQAGVSTMGVYSRFGGKDGVVDALFREGFDGLKQAISTTPESSDPLDDLRTCCRAYRSFALAHGTHYRIMFEGAVPGFTASDASLEVAAATYESVAERVRRCVEAGQLSGGTHYEIAASLWAACHGLVSLELLAKKPAILADDAPYERTMAAILRGFAPDPAKSTG